jgi:hypothetical protein
MALKYAITEDLNPPVQKFLDGTSLPGHGSSNLSSFAYKMK